MQATPVGPRSAASSRGGWQPGIRNGQPTSPDTEPLPHGAQVMTKQTGMTHGRGHEVRGTDQMPCDSGPGEAYHAAGGLGPANGAHRRFDRFNGTVPCEAIAPENANHLLNKPPATSPLAVPSVTLIFVGKGAGRAAPRPHCHNRLHAYVQRDRDRIGAHETTCRPVLSQAVGAHCPVPFPAGSGEAAVRIPVQQISDSFAPDIN